MRSRHPSSPNVFTLERLSCLRSPIKPIAWGRVSFCEHFFNSNEGRFKRRVIRGENRHSPKFVVLKHYFFLKKNQEPADRERHPISQSGRIPLPAILPEHGTRRRRGKYQAYVKCEEIDEMFSCNILFYC